MESFNKPSALSLCGNLAENWRRFFQQFEIYITAADKEKADDKVKVALLLNFAGEEALEVFNTFSFPEDKDKADFKKVQQKFEEYCNPRKNVVFERYKYWKTTQLDENISTFVTTLKQKIKTCEYPATILDDMVRDKLVFGVKDIAVKERLLRESTLTLEKALDICRASEQSKDQVKSMSATESHTNQVDSMKAATNDNSAKPRERSQNESLIQCRFCGTSHKRRACPAYGKICNFCKAIGHFESMCYRKKKSQGVHVIKEPQIADEPTEVCFSVDNKKGGNDWKACISVNGSPLLMKIDTGADCNVVSKQKLDHNGIQYKLQKNQYSHLNVYGGEKVKVNGKTTLECDYKGKFHVLTFIVIDKQAPTILGLPGIEELGVVKRVYSIKQEDNVLQEYSDVFTGLGKIKGVEHTIRLKPDAIPVVHPPRRVPVKLREQLKEELNRMEELKVIEKVSKPTEWVNSLVVVRKKNNKIRVCMDPSDLNKNIMREHYPMKSVEEVVSRTPGAQVFTVLDANHGFWQIELAEESKQLCTFNTPFGRYAFKRLPFGISSAPEVFQSVMTQLFDDLEGCEVIVDDLLVWGRNTEEHDQRLRKVLDRARQCNVKLNKDKCQLRQDTVTYIGHQLTAEGLKPDQKKVEAVEMMKYPQSKEELQRYLGMITYLSKFIPSMSQITVPLRELLEKQIAWHWDEKHATAFDKLKAAIISAPVLKYFDPEKPITLSVDASSKGLGAVILQDEKPIAYASRAMTSTEQNYAQIEREMLAITFGCDRFHEYLYGQEIVHVETDHKPIEAIKKKPIHCAPQRIQRMLLKVQPYALDIKYKPGKELHIADALSRDYLPDTSGSCEEEFEVHLLESGHVGEFTYPDLVKYTKEELTPLYNVILHGWPENKKQLPENVKDYWSFRDELSIQDGLILKSERIVIPATMQKLILERLHLGHSGRERTKEKARNSVYWPGLNSAIDDMVDRCSACLKYSRQQQREPMIPHTVPERPWQVVCMDHFYFNGQDYLLIVDYFSKYPEVTRVHQKTAGSTITGAKEIFARHGIPERIIADNMPFNSFQFRQFCNKWGIEVVTSSPTYYRSHGLVERFVETLKQMLRKGVESGDDSFLALLELRNTPISELGHSPAELLMSRKLRTMVPVSSSLLKPKVVDKARERLLQRQVKQKLYYDRGTKSLPELQAGDSIRVQKGSAWEPGVVVGKCNTPRSYDIITANGQELRRNRSHLLATKEPAPTIIPSETTPTDETPEQSASRDIDTSLPCNQASSAENSVCEGQQTDTPITGLKQTRSGRVVRKPDRYCP